MEEFFKELFEYTHHYNQQFIQLLLDHPNKASEKTISLMSHTLNAHGNWNARILFKPAPHQVWGVHPVETLLDLDKENYQTSLELIESKDFGEIIPYTTSAGQPFQHTVRDMLFQVINHSAYHRAQMNTEWKQSGLAPLVTDYIFYKR